MSTQRALLPLYRLRFNLLYQFGFLDIRPDEYLPYEQEDQKGHPAVTAADLLAKLPAFSTADEIVLLDIEVPTSTAATQFQPIEQPDLRHHYPQLTPTTAAALETLMQELQRPVAAPATASLRLEMRQVRRLYPLTEQASKLLASRLDERIQRQPAVFESVATQADHRQLAEETRRGCEALFDIVGLPVVPPTMEILADIEQAVAIRLGKRQLQPADSFLVHLIVYDRHDPFPKSDYGYLYDLGAIFSRKKSPSNNYEHTSFYKALEDNRAAATGAVTKLLNEAPWATTLRDNLTDNATELRQYLVAVLYLKWRQEFEAANYVFSSRITEQVKAMADHRNYRHETEVALQLLGGLLTFDKLAASYYGAAQIPLFQKNGQRLKPLSSIQPESVKSKAAQLQLIPTVSTALMPDVDTLTPGVEYSLALNSSILQQTSQQEGTQHPAVTEGEVFTVTKPSSAKKTVKPRKEALLSDTAEPKKPRLPRGKKTDVKHPDEEHQ